MRKIVFFYLIFGYFDLYGQSNNVVRVGQIFDESCWAACIEMMGLDSQCNAIKKVKHNTGNDCCDGHCYNVVGIPPTNIYSYYTLLKPEKYAIKFDTLASLLPVMQTFKYLCSDCASSFHYVVFSDVEKYHSIYYNKEISLNLIKVNDPWPLKKGNTFYTTYEMYYQQAQCSDCFHTIIHKRESPLTEQGFQDTTVVPNSLFDQDYKKLFKKLKNILKSNLLSDSFKISTGLAGSLKNIKLGKLIEIKEVPSGAIISNEDGSDEIESFLAKLNNSNEILLPILKNKKIIAALTLLNIGSPTETNWIIYRIEDGEFLNETFNQLRFTNSNRNNKYYFLKIIDQEDKFTFKVENNNIKLFNLNNTTSSFIGPCATCLPKILSLEKLINHYKNNLNN